MTEEWRPYPPAPDSYLVSESGAIYSRPRKVGGPYGSRKLKGRLLKPTFTPRGYPSYRVQVAGASKLIMAHAAVMEAFVGPRPEGMEVCHWDDNPKNNHVSNLRYSTHSENTLDSVRNGNHNNARKTPLFVWSRVYAGQHQVREEAQWPILHQVRERKERPSRSGDISGEIQEADDGRGD